MIFFTHINSRYTFQKGLFICSAFFWPVEGDKHHIIVDVKLTSQLNIFSFLYVKLEDLPRCLFSNFHFDMIDWNYRQ